MIVRLADPTDAPLIADLINRAYRVEDLYLHGDRTTEAEVRELLAIPGAICLLVDAQRTPSPTVGAAFVQVRGNRGYVGPVAVDPSVQGRGWGKHLMTAAEIYCGERGCTWLDLDVLSTQEELLPFYESLGFAQTGTAPYPKPGRLRQDGHLIVMAKRLHSSVAPWRA